MKSFSDATRLRAVSETGCPIGEDSAVAKYLDSDVDKVFFLRSQGLSYRKIGQKMDMSKSTVFAICKGLIRAQMPSEYRKFKNQKRKNGSE